MSTFPNSPRLVKGGLALLDPSTSAVVRIVPLQYNPDTITRTLQPQNVKEGGDRAEATRLTGPPIETIKLEAEIDATDDLESPDRHPAAASLGIQPQLAALETILYPTSTQLIAANALARSGTLEIIPMLAPLTVFIWSKSRVMPVRITECSVTEEAFDPALNPIRAKVSLGLRVLSVSDLGFDQKGGNLFLGYQQQKEALAARSPAGAFSNLGLGGLP